jgi:hypothetical protein
MKTGLLLAAVLLVLTAAAHSFLGERYILMRLFRRENLPRLFGGDEFTKRTLRFAWHVTSVAWLGFAGLLVVLAKEAAPPRAPLLQIVAATFLCTAVIAALGSRGKHLSWIVFAAMALLVWLAL